MHKTIFGSIIFDYKFKPFCFAFSYYFGIREKLQHKLCWKNVYFYNVKHKAVEIIPLQAVPMF